MIKDTFYAISFGLILGCIAGLIIAITNIQKDINDVKRIIIHQSEAIILIEQILIDDVRRREIHDILEMEPPTIYIPNIIIDEDEEI